MGTVTIDGKTFDCADEVVALLQAVSEERDELKELARDVVCARLDYLNPVTYYVAMEPASRTAHRLLKEVGE